MEIATPAFIETYDYRPNRLFIEYLIYPKEVFSMLMEGHLSAVIFSLVLLRWLRWFIGKFPAGR
ncbi:phosphoglycerol transferase [Rodentibacter pneumotropicus]|uniref:Phosphoglycerol transferase n=1 Tax=Rodentibacter pneumotropicus TaxID=758 RepID=A0A3S4UQJ5_9PAST|nr:phosphoglycerol transferase [Rodentibacter pneumotropicus]